MSEPTDAIGQMFTLPMDMFNQTMKGMAQLAEGSIKAMSGMFAGCCDEKAPSTTDAHEGVTQEETEPMTDHDHHHCCCRDNDDDSCNRDRLYDFTVVTLQRGKAKVLAGGRQLDTDCMKGEDFSNWLIADYVRTHYDTLSGEAVKYLRVNTMEIKSWTKPPLEYREDQLDVLREIRDRI